MKRVRLPLQLSLIGSALLTLFFGWMLTEALQNDRKSFQRDIAFQSGEQAITVNASKSGLERRVQVLASTLALDPRIRELVTRASESGSATNLAPLRETLRNEIAPYWGAINDGGAVELNVFLDGDRPQVLLSLSAAREAPVVRDAPVPRHLLRESRDRRAAIFGTEFDGQNATTVGIAPIRSIDDETDSLPLVGLLEVAFGITPDAEYLDERLESGVALLTREPGETGVSRWRIDDASRPEIERWQQERRLPAVTDGPGHTVLTDSDGFSYLLTLVPFGASGDDDGSAVAAAAVWNDITWQVEGLDDLFLATWIRWGVAWLIAEACLLALLWATRRVTRRTMLDSQERLESQKATLEALNHRLAAQKEALQALNDIAAQQEISFPLLMERALKMGAAHLDMPFAVANQIDGEDYIIQAGYSPDNRFVRGQVLETRDTYCSEVVASNDVVAFADADAEGWSDHRCHQLFQLKSYIGAPIWVHGQRFGALSFSGDSARTHPFDEADHEFVRLLARWVGGTLMRWQEVEAREELSGRLSKIASQTPGLIFQYRIDADGHASFPYASDAINGYYGMTPAEAAADASKVIEMIPEEDRAKVVESIAESQKHLTPWHSEYRIRHPDGRVIWVAGQSIPEREADGGTLWHGFVHDVTERKRGERLKGEFISTVSHELRTPLTSISGSLGLIQGGALGAPPESMRSMLAVAHNNAQRLILLINDLLDMEKLAAGKMAFEMEAQPLMPLIDLAVESNQGYADQYQVHYAVTQRVEDAWVSIDAMRLQQVLSNLLSNAAKFSPPNMQVEVRVEPLGDCVRVSIVDHGPGIPEAFHERIFQKFSQADASTTRKQGGTGLGLSITRELIERMRGSINFFSKEGHGACFFFELPLLERSSVVALDKPEQQAEPTVLAGEDLPSGARVLIVEDDPDTALLLAVLVRQWGYRAETAHTLDEATQWLERRSFDAITLDLKLPDGSGLTLLRQLREQPRTRDLPVLVLSAIADEGRLEIGGELNAVDWLGKPLDEKRLAAALQGSTRGASSYERVLHLESDTALTQRIAGYLAPALTLDVARSLQEARYLMANNDYDLISLDLTAGDSVAWEMIPLLSQLAHQPAVIIFSEQALSPTLLGQVDTAIAAPGLSPEALREAFERQLKARGNDSTLTGELT
ncbi:GAF domain-containing hybrid sensor histidine kinase/response regulator [Salinicola aestuarinus]|uniref:GAF domain-containing hybrid sensor histidine kinase/response regulator n=1 Tax=Salinicola aestuarinus TaxID=1949082 RepID=UPI000DA1A0F6|nr:GAF domain-containing hybrid sensor histidine kinase/response regulator [Salinicola aestuarinus]